MPAIQVFIPRIIGGISANFLKQTFKTLNVGNITYLDMRSRLNSNNYSYSFAFLTIELFETDLANKLFQKLKQTGHAQLAYDEYNYWEIKDYIPRGKRLSQFEQDIEAPPAPLEACNQTIAISIEDDEPAWMYDQSENKTSIAQISEKTNEFESWMIQQPMDIESQQPMAVESPKCLPSPPQSKFLPLFESLKCFPKANSLPSFEPSIQSLCNELLHYRPWSYPQAHVDAQHPSYYPSKYLSNDVKDYDDIQRDINAIVDAQNVYRLF